MILNPPGPNPDICVCGGRMSMPIRGRHTGLWIRTCRVCQRSTHTTDTPPELEAREPIGLPYATRPLPFDRFNRDAIETRLREGEREPGAEG